MVVERVEMSDQPMKTGLVLVEGLVEAKRVLVAERKALVREGRVGKNILFVLELERTAVLLAVLVAEMTAGAVAVSCGS